MSPQQTATDTTRGERALVKSLARRCQGKTLVLGQGFQPLVDYLRSRGVDVVARASYDDGHRKDERFTTVVLVRALEYLSPEAAPAELDGAWRRVDERGSLLVCVPNEDHVGTPGVAQRFTRRSLKGLLKRIDQPRAFTDQPFGWLSMALQAGTRMDRTTEERHRVIARLCRGEVLELGCAAGHLSRRIADRGLVVSGVDKNTDKIAKARRLFPEIPFRQADILKMTVDRRYATVVLAEVLEHVPEETGTAMLNKAWDFVEPGGRLVVSVPNEDCVPHKNHLCEFTAGDLKKRLRPFGHPRLITDQPFKWLLMVVQRQS